MSCRRDSTDYAFEELVAELTSAYCTAHFGIQGMTGHPECLGHWLARLENDTRYFFDAARLAATAAGYLGLSVAVLTGQPRA